MRTLEHQIEELEQVISANDAEMNKIADAARRLLYAFEIGVFVRNTEHDHERDWAIKAFPHLKADLAEAVAYESRVVK